MALEFEPLAWSADRPTVIAFLTANPWPFHAMPRLSPEDAAAVTVVGDDIATFWIRDGDQTIGLIRLFDLDDCDDGSPLFDLRIGEHHRGRGIGRVAVRWLTDHLFATYQGLYRIEATTRSDNLAMQAVFGHCGFRQEGRMLEAWKNADGTRSDTLLYAILRREWSLGDPDDDLREHGSHDIDEGANMRVTRVTADLRVADINSARDFYTDYLGLDVEGFNLGWVARYQSEDGQVHIQLVTRDATSPEDPVVSVAVGDDLDEAYAEAQRRGYEIVHPLTTEPWGIRRFFVRAPDGNVININGHRDQ